MDRRGFLRFLGAGVAGIALEQAIPLGRVWSFPKQIALPGELGAAAGFEYAGLGNTLLTVTWVTQEHLRVLEHNLRIARADKLFEVGDVIEIAGVIPAGRLGAHPSAN
jgi:hypothetical protein